jgi:DNA-binding response OmpR family regulator
MPDILICGEDPVALRALEALLQAAGFPADRFSHLSRAVTPCLRGSYKLAIVALGSAAFPRTQERLELIRVMREISPKLPLVVVSDPESLEIERELRSLGIFYLLTMPLSPKELKDVVQCALNK